MVTTTQDEKVMKGEHAHLKRIVVNYKNFDFFSAPSLYINVPQKRNKHQDDEE